MAGKRVNAWSMLYVEGTFQGKPLIGTGALLDRGSIPEGFYCYDTKTDMGCPDAAHTAVLLNPSDEANGSVVLAGTLEFGTGDEISMEGIRLLEDQPLVRLDAFMEKTEALGNSRNGEMRHVQSM